MRLDGWILMIASWTVIIGLLIFALSRTLRSKTKPNLPNSPNSPDSSETR